MTVPWQKLVSKYRRQGILLDTNLLLVLIVGLVNPRLLSEFKRTANHGITPDEFELLQRIVTSPERLITTPHVLTETSNFLSQIPNGHRQEALNLFARHIQVFKERRPEAKQLAKSAVFFDLGLTDSAIYDLPPSKYLVLSMDAPLVLRLQKKGVDAINFNHIRQAVWES